MFKYLSTITLLAVVSIPTVALADKYSVTTPEITTTTGSASSQTDVGHMSRHNQRDFVRDPTGLQGAANVGGGFGEAWGLGLGARLGYTLPRRVYVGGAIAYHLGTTAENQGVDMKSKTWFFGPEAGYDIGVGKFILRPVIGVGLAFKKMSTTGPNVAALGIDTNETDTKFYVAPGAQLQYPIGNFFVGADSRAMFMSNNSTLTFLGAVGAHL